MTIVKLEPSKRVDERWLCWLEDGSIIRVTENEVVAFALYAGMEVSDELYDRLTEAAGRSTVRAKAVDYISHRPMSRKELTDKLTARPPRGKDGRQREPLATPELAGETAAWLEDLGGPALLCQGVWRPEGEGRDVPPGHSPPVLGGRFGRGPARRERGGRVFAKAVQRAGARPEGAEAGR